VESRKLSGNGEQRDSLGKLHRAVSILSRYGIGSARMKKRLRLYASLLGKFNCSVTFPVTACLLRKHSFLCRELIGNSIEMAIHGQKHVDLTNLPQEGQLEVMEEAKQAFHSSGLHFSGFRSPYLRWNQGTAEALKTAGFSCSSNRTLLWYVVELQDLNETQWINYNQVVEFYGAQPVDEFLSLPRFSNGVLDIPVSLPDDEMLVERLRLTDSEKIGSIWNSMLDMSYKYGEIFTLQLHPERIEICCHALENLLSSARSAEPIVWIATLSEVAEWWKKKREFGIRAYKLDGSSSYGVEVDCSDSATILAKSVDIQCDSQSWSDGYSLVKSRNFQVRCPVRPFIGIPDDFSDSLIRFLRGNGYVVETSINGSDYGVYLDSSAEKLSQRELIEYIEGLDVPMVRFWRWPHGYKSVLCVTGDIDAITLWDFAARIWK
jgi:hypothetical protein